MIYRFGHFLSFPSATTRLGLGILRHLRFQATIGEPITWFPSLISSGRCSYHPTIFSPGFQFLFCHSKIRICLECTKHTSHCSLASWMYLSTSVRGFCESSAVHFLGWVILGYLNILLSKTFYSMALLGQYRFACVIIFQLVFKQ